MLYQYFEELQESLKYRKLDIIQFEKAIKIQKSENQSEDHDYKKTLQTFYYNCCLIYTDAIQSVKGQIWLQSQDNWKSIAEEYAKKSLDLSEEVFGKESKEYQESEKIIQKYKKYKNAKCGAKC